MRITAMLKHAWEVLDDIRPCKRAIKAIESNVEITRELNDSIKNLNETLSDYRVPQRRSGDPEQDDSWRQRASP